MIPYPNQSNENAKFAKSNNNNRSNATFVGYLHKRSGTVAGLREGDKRFINEPAFSMSPGLKTYKMTQSSISNEINYFKRQIKNMNESNKTFAFQKGKDDTMVGQVKSRNNLFDTNTTCKISQPLDIEEISDQSDYTIKMPEGQQDF